MTRAAVLGTGSWGTAFGKVLADAGTDAGAEWLRLLYVVSIGSIAAAVAWRLSSSPAPARRAPS